MVGSDDCDDDRPNPQGWDALGCVMGHRHMIGYLTLTLVDRMLTGSTIARLVATYYGCGMEHSGASTVDPGYPVMLLNVHLHQRPFLLLHCRGQRQCLPS